MDNRLVKVWPIVRILCVYVCMYVCMYVCVCMCVCMYVCMYVCICACVCMCACMCLGYVFVWHVDKQCSWVDYLFNAKVWSGG